MADVPGLRADRHRRSRAGLSGRWPARAQFLPGTYHATPVGDVLLARNAGAMPNNREIAGPTHAARRLAATFVLDVARYS